MDRYLGQTNRLQHYLKFILITRIEKQSSTHAGERFSCHFVVALFFQKFDRTLMMKNGVTIRHCLAPPPLYIYLYAKSTSYFIFEDNHDSKSR
jgi:hypothetical protein